MRKADYCLTPKEIERRLEEFGIQATAQRIAISQFVLCEGNHPTAEVVKKWADKNISKVSLATVYNTHQLLVKNKLLVERRFTHIDKLTYDPNVTDHHHLIDLKNNLIMDIDANEITMKLSDKNVEIEHYEVFVYGKEK